MDEKIQVGLNYLRRFPETLSLEELVELKEKIDRALKDKEYSIAYDTTKRFDFHDPVSPGVLKFSSDVLRYERYVENQTIQEVAQAFCKRLSSCPVKITWIKLWNKSSNKWELVDTERLPEPKASYWARLEILHEPALRDLGPLEKTGRQARDLSEQVLTAQLLAWDDS